MAEKKAGESPWTVGGVKMSGRLSGLQRVRAWVGQALEVGCRSSLRRVVAAWSVSASPVGGANQVNGRGEGPRQSRAAHPPGWSARVSCRAGVFQAAYASVS
jgi:hypothetical protein